MNPREIKKVLQRLQNQEMSLDEAINKISVMPFENLAELAVVDHHRHLRTGVPEVVFGASKTGQEIATIMQTLAEKGLGALATKVSESKAETIDTMLPHAVYNPRAQTVLIEPEQKINNGKGTIVVLSAGSSDSQVATETCVTAEFLGNEVHWIGDVGVAGIHRLSIALDPLREASVIVVVAGMEGALPSVVAGLVDKPLIAVPTSIGYGVGLGGFVAMLGMLSSCAPGITVVNIDNGFGAGVAASLINRK